MKEALNLRFPAATPSDYCDRNVEIEIRYEGVMVLFLFFFCDDLDFLSRVFEELAKHGGCVAFFAMAGPPDGDGGQGG
jgi:hypothetical protein